MSTLTFVEYEREALKTRIYPDDKATEYPALALAGEVGEVCQAIKKDMRDGYGDLNRLNLMGEIGDILWYLVALADDQGLSLADCAEYNLAKLAGRSKRGTLGGSGEDR